MSSFLLILSALALALSQYLDIVTTREVLATPRGIERNPVMRFVMRLSGEQWVWFKVGTVVTAFLLVALVWGVDAVAWGSAMASAATLGAAWYNHKQVA